MANKPLGFPFGFFTNDNTPDSGKYWNRIATPPRPYLNVTEAMSVLPVGVRHAGLTINIAGLEYWILPNETDLTKDFVVKTIDSPLITKAGSDVDANGDLSLVAETIKDFPNNPTIYIDGISGGYQTQYNNTTKVISGLYGVDSSAIIKIKF